MPHTARMDQATPAQLVTLLKEAAAAYYNGKPLMMDDDTYDAMLDRLRELDPTNTYLATVGAPPAEGAVPLPAKMPSLEKIKPGQPNLAAFLASPGPFILSDKLDGLSALWCSESSGLYLRGDGSTGQSISHLVPHIQGLQRRTGANRTWMIRGELILPRSSVPPGTLGRTLVNGYVHRKGTNLAITELSKVRFVAYEVIEPAAMTRSEQFSWLATNGFEVPWFSVTPTLTETHLADHFRTRREASPYETDGIVVALDQRPAPLEVSVAGIPRTPRDMVAFKMPLAEQSAATTVRAVLWAPSAQGYLIPRLQFDPIQIGGATIEFCTAHNARTVVDARLGPGARVRIRRSGDVIPTLDAVLVEAPQPALPEDPDTWEWAPGDAHLRLKGVSPLQQASQLQHFAKCLSIPAMGPASCKTLVEAGLTGPRALWEATSDRLSSLLGPKSGANLYASLRTALGRPDLDEVELLLASSKLSRGIGDAKLVALASEFPDPASWATLTNPPSKGWTEETFRAFQASMRAYELWRTQELGWIPYPKRACLATVAPGVVPTHVVCFTGFRDKDLEACLKAAGHSLAPSLTSKVTHLLTPDGNNAETNSEKAKKAATMGTITILRRSDYIQKYLNPQ